MDTSRAFRDIFVKTVPMTRLLSVGASFLFILFSQAQDARFFIGVQASPDLAYRSLQLVERSSLYEDFIDARNRFEVPRLGFTGNLFAGYMLSERFGIEVGLGYALRGWELDLSKLTFGDIIDPRRGFIYNTNDVIGSIREEFHYLTIPVRGTCTLGHGRFRFIGGLGLSTDLLQKAERVSILNGERLTYERLGVEEIDLTAIASAGVVLRLGSKGSLRLEPTVRHGLLPVNSTSVATRLCSAGIAFGFVHNL